MRIEIVQLENVRSHVKSTVPFARGFNCLVGGLGCGKSSILYAVDFALFGDPVGKSFDYLLREGAESAKISVQFMHGGKSYRISRGLKRRGRGISQDFDELKLFVGDELVSSVKNDAVGEQLRAITGFDKELFREIAWVKQEHMKELLDAQPRERQRRLDELFGLSDYEIAWSNLAGYQREYEGERRAYERDPDVAGMEKLGSEYSRTAEEFSLLELELQDLTAKLATAKKALEEADLGLKKLEEVRVQNEELKRKEAIVNANLVNLQEALVSMAENIEEKKAVVGNFQQQLIDLEAQAASFKTDLRKIGISSDQTLEDLRNQISSFDDQILNLRSEQEVGLKNVQADRSRVSSLSTENRCPLCMQPLTEDYRRDLTQRIQDENDERLKTADRLNDRIKELQQLKSKASTAFTGLQMLATRIEDLKARMKEETEVVNGLCSEFGEKQRREKEILLELESMHIQLNRFNASELEAAKSQRERAFRQYYLLESESRSKENHEKELTKRMDEIKERIDRAQEKIERMEKIVKAIEIVGSIRDAYRSIQPKLRSEFVKILGNFVQQVMDSLAGGEGPFLNLVIDETYTLNVMSESGVEREASNLSGGERTLLAFAYRLGLGQLIMQSRTGHGLSILLLDEPTESLGTEDGSIDRLAEAISRFKAIEQTIAVTHSEAFAEKAEHVIRLEKEAGESRVSVER